MEKETERRDKYFICHECSKAKGWTPPKWPVTVTQGLCGHCNRPDKTILTPVVDFSGPGKKAIWD